MTPALQALDAGIIPSFKCHYQKHLWRYIVSLIDSGKVVPHHVDVKQALSMIVSAWSDVTPTTIQNCWRHTGIMYTPPRIVTSFDSIESEPVAVSDDHEDSCMKMIIL